MFFVVADSDDQFLNKLNKDTIEWTNKAARGECPWVCADCSCSFQDGMPCECIHGDERCTRIIERDKQRALEQGRIK